MNKVITKSAEETKKLAKKIAEDFKDSGGVIALIGNLGVGKTTFTQGFAGELGIKERVTSPTFVLLRQHALPYSERIFYHLDLYRLENVNLFELGLKEIFDSATKDKNIVLIEWAEKIADQFPKETLFIKFNKVGENIREVILTKS